MLSDTLAIGHKNRSTPASSSVSQFAKLKTRRYQASLIVQSDGTLQFDLAVRGIRKSANRPMCAEPGWVLWVCRDSELSSFKRIAGGGHFTPPAARLRLSYCPHECALGYEPGA